MGSTKTTIIEGTSDPKEDKQVVSINETAENKNTRRTRIRGNQYKINRAKINKEKSYSLADAIKLVKETSYSKFDGTVELHLVLKKKGLSLNIKFPKQVGKKKKIETASDATITQLKAGKIDFDVLLATPEFMPKIVPFAQILGPRGLMPNPKTGTLIKSEEEAKNFSADDTVIKTEPKAPLVHVKIGKVSWTDKDLINNAEIIIKAIGTQKIIKAHLCPTMGPSVKIDVD